MPNPNDRFRENLTILRNSTDPDPVDLRPSSAFEAITRQMVESLMQELQEIRTRLNGLIFMMIGAVVLDAISRVVGP